MRERGGRDGAGDIMEAPMTGDKQPHRRGRSASAERETKGQSGQLGKGTKNSKASAASLPGDSQAAPVIYEAWGSLPPEGRQDLHPRLGDP